MRAFLALLEGGLPIVRTALLAEKVAPDALVALRRAVVLRPSSPAPTVPRDDPKKLCFRLVRRSPPGHTQRLIGACRNAGGPGCPPRDVTEEEVAQEDVSLPDLARALRALYDVDGRGLSVPSVFDGKPATLGWTGEGNEERAVLLVLSPSRALSSELAGSRRALVLVPTARTITPEERSKHKPGAFVSLEVLEESLAADGGHLARAHSLAPDAPIPPS